VVQEIPPRAGYFYATISSILYFTWLLLCLTTRVTVKCMKRFFVIIVIYFLLSSLYVISGVNISDRCYRNVSNYKVCIPIMFTEFILSLPAILVSHETPLRFVWRDGNTGMGVGNYEFRGLKIGNTVLFKTWQIFHPI
jgi:hypothetical protein